MAYKFKIRIYYYYNLFIIIIIIIIITTTIIIIISIAAMARIITIGNGKYIPFELIYLDLYCLIISRVNRYLSS